MSAAQPAPHAAPQRAMAGTALFGRVQRIVRGLLHAVRSSEANGIEGAIF